MKIEARFAALEHVVIATIVAADAHDGRTIARTMRVAQAFEDFAHRSDPPGTAMCLGALLETLQAAQVRKPPRRKPGDKVIPLHARSLAGSTG